MIDPNKTGRLTPEEQKEIEEKLNIKILDLDEGIIEFQGKKWKPIKSMEDLLIICHVNEPVLRIGEGQWVDFDYEM